MVRPQNILKEQLILPSIHLLMIANNGKKGINKIAQKVGEEAAELITAAKDNNPKLLKNETADLLFHYLVLLSSKGF